MIRILGAITGSALALATLLVVIGIPQFKTEGTASEHAIVTLPLPTSPVDPDDTSSGESAASDDVVPVKLENDGDAGDESLDSAQARIEDALAAAPPPAGQNAAEAGGLAPDPSPAAEPRPVLDTPQSWYAFWSPFRSELAAKGFIAQLQSVTGLDYRVVRVKPGVYEVAFAYESDEDITTKLTQITAATGLELPQ